jgi:hypothetical protein
MLTRKSIPTFLCALLCVLPAIPSLAQVNKSVIEVVVLDQEGGVLPGVTVTVTRDETGFQSTAVTGQNGWARFPALDPGTYELLASIFAFAPLTQSGIALRVGQTRRLTIALQTAAAEVITVTAPAHVVDLYRSDTSTNIIPEQIQMLPVADRDFQRLAFIAPGVQRERGAFRGILGGPVIGSGGNASQSTILVDGVNLTDPTIGLARSRFSLDAIQEFRVISNGFDTEIGGSAGGALSIVTKSGTNDLSGTVFGFFRDDALRENSPLALSETPFERTQFGFTVGGPIVRDRSHFFFSFEQVNEKNVSLFRPAGAFADRAADVQHPMGQNLAYLGMDFSLNDNQHAAAKVVYAQHRETNLRVGGVADISAGSRFGRDEANLTLEHRWILSDSMLNELRLNGGTRKYEQRVNSTAAGEWFSSGNTLQTGANSFGNVLFDGEIYELRNTFHFDRGNHIFKGGIGIQYVDDRSRIEPSPHGLFIYVGDDRSLPLRYTYGVGSPDVTKATTIYSAFVEDSWRARPNLTISAGLRYDLDTNGNNPDFTHPLVGDRKVDGDNIQPRLSVTWDTNGRGRYVVRGGAGLFTGRYLLIPAVVELQQNGVTGRQMFTRLNGALFGQPGLALDVERPTTTGIPLPVSIMLLEDNLEAPEAMQLSLGMTTRLGESRLYLDTDLIYVKGDEEITIRDTNWRGNATGGRFNPAWDQINMFTNDGRSEYKALVVGLNGTFGKGHLLTGSVTAGNKKNISDDFSPEFPGGFPNDPADIDAEWGRARTDERWRVVISGIFRLPWMVTVAPIYQYGSGQPFTRRLGYDWNGDGKNSDRPVGVKRFAENGPEFSSLSVRLTKTFALGRSSNIHFIVEGFNVTNETNYDVTSVDSALFLNGPTRVNPTAAHIVNPNYGRYRATLPSREFQIGVRWSF